MGLGWQCRRHRRPAACRQATWSQHRIAPLADVSVWIELTNGTTIACEADVVWVTAETVYLRTAAWTTPYLLSRERIRDLRWRPRAWTAGGWGA